MTKTVKVMKYEIIKPLNMKWEEFGKELFKLSNEARTLANKTIQHCWHYNNAKVEYKEENGSYPKDKEFISIVYRQQLMTEVTSL